MLGFVVAQERYTIFEGDLQMGGRELEKEILIVVVAFAFGF